MIMGDTSECGDVVWKGRVQSLDWLLD